MKRRTLSLDEVFDNDLRDTEFQKQDRLIKPYYDLVAEIVNRRIELNLTQKELAKRANTFQSRISKIESGEHNFRFSTIIQISEALEAELSIKLIPLESKRQAGINNDLYQQLFNRKSSKGSYNLTTGRAIEEQTSGVDVMVEVV